MYYFISFASEDRVIKEKVREMLYIQNIKYWVDDSEIILGNDIRSRINAAISDTTATIVIVSRCFFKESDAYPWCKYELSKILDKSENGEYLVLPIFIEPIENIRRVLNPQDKELLNKLTNYHGLKTYEFEDDLAYDYLQKYLIDKEMSNNSIIQDENGYYCYWGTEYGQIDSTPQTPLNYLFIDTVHSDKGREYVIIGKFELLSKTKKDRKYNEEYHKTALKLFNAYIEKNKKQFYITFTDKSVLRHEFTIETKDEFINGRFTGRVNGLYPFGMNISINYIETLLEL